MSVNDQEVAAMRERLQRRQEERRALADIDALARIVSASRRPETIGVIVPIDEAKDFARYIAAKQRRGDDTALGLVLIAVNILIVAILGICAVLA